MTIPPFLNSGDTVAIVAPAGVLAPEQISYAIKHIESWGLKVKTGKNLFSRFFNFSGTDEQRIDDLQEALDNPEIKAIFCARGGYGLIRIVDTINWSAFIRSPKWVIGFSDITVLHSYINNKLNIASVHGPMPAGFEKLKEDTVSLPSLKKILFSETITYEIKNYRNDFPSEISGKLLGGNLSLLYSLRGTPYDFPPENNILFIEEVSEFLYHIDRMLQNFRIGKKFNGLKAIILGGFTEIKENDIPFGFTIEEIINNVLYKENVPVINNFPAGHITPNYPIVLGGQIKIKREGNSVKITQNQ